LASEATTVRPPPPRPENHSIPVLAIERAQLTKLRIDHRAGFLLALIDGATTVESMLDVCGMPTADAIQLLDQLVRDGVVALT
jgi:hypothetical protein